MVLWTMPQKHKQLRYYTYKHGHMFADDGGHGTCATTGGLRYHHYRSCDLLQKYRSRPRRYGRTPRAAASIWQYTNRSSLAGRCSLLVRLRFRLPWA